MAQGRAENTEQAFGQEMLLEALRATFESECADRGEDAVAKLSGLLGPGIDPRDFWELARESLSRGALGLIFVADPRSPVMQRVADFLNSRMFPDGTSWPRAPAGSPSLDPLADLVLQIRVWDERAFFRELEAQRGPDEAANADAILAWARDRGLAIRWDGDEARGGFTPWLEVRGERHTAVTIWTDGTIEFGNLPLRDASVPEHDGFALSRLSTDPGALEGFIAALDRAVDSILAGR
jgi:hypothetical protein